MTLTRQSRDVPPTPVQALPLGTTRARYALLISVLVLAAVLAGNLIFYPFLGQQYGNALKVCLVQIPDRSALDANEQFSRCKAPAEWQRVLFALGFGALVVLLGAALLRRLPARLYRRVGRVRVASQRWQDAAAEAVRSMGGRVVPEVVFASACREAFTVRVEGRVRIVLPNGVLALPTEEATALLRHECAHVVAGDVDRVWLTRALWWATPAILVLPLLVDVERGLLSSNKTFIDEVLDGFNRDFVIRSVLLLGLVWVVSRGVLRSREHEADLLATHSSAGSSSAGGVHLASLRTVLGRGHDASVSRLRGLIALHPLASKRVDVLDRGAVERHARGVEGFAFGALAGIVQSMAAFFIGPLVSPLPNLQLSMLAIALIPGALLGFAWGPTIWRSVVAADSRRWTHRAVDALGLPLGAIVGLSLDLTASGSPWVNTGTAWIWGFTAVALTGATALCVGVAALWHQHRSSATVPRWVGPLAAVVFIAAIELSESTRNTIHLVDWDGVLIVLLAQPWWVLVAGQCAIAAAVWWVSSGSGIRLLTLSIAVAAPVAGMRLLLAEPVTVATAQDHMVVDFYLAAGAGLVCFLSCAAVRGRAGIGLGVAAAWSTALLVSTTLPLAFNHPQAVIKFYLTMSSSTLAVALLMVSAFMITLPCRDTPVQAANRQSRTPATVDHLDHK